MMEITLPKRAGALLAALRAAEGRWVNRIELADLTGKRTLSPNDRRWLEALEKVGDIEAKKQEAANPKGFEWVYRATQKE